jgi:transposase
MVISALGIDLAKSVFQLHGVDERGRVVLTRQLSRGQLLEYIAKLPKCLIGMEACSGAHFWARKFKTFGHDVRIIAPQFVKPYVKSNKNDRIDAEAICEALTRPSMRFVSAKSIDQHDIQCIHRVRERLISARTALMNEIRGLLAEYGVVLPVGKSALLNRLSDLLEKAVSRSDMTTLSFTLFSEMHAELRELDQRIGQLDDRIQALYDNHPVAQRIGQIPGVGPLTATAIVAATANPGDFKNGRQFSAWLGLVPRQNSTGGKNRLLGISKRGNVYIRKLLVHGARSAFIRMERHPDWKQTQWLKQLEVRRGVNRSVVALANKNARRIWAVMAYEEEFKQQCA